VSEPVPAGHFRVIVVEADARMTHRDFDSRDAAIAYANDAAAEDGGPLATVYDDTMTAIHEGRAYFS
jgi:hypothetical protein